MRVLVATLWKSDIRENLLRVIFPLVGLTFSLLLLVGELSGGEIQRVYLDVGYSLILLIVMGTGIVTLGLRWRRYLDDGLFAWLTVQGFSRQRVVWTLLVVSAIHQLSLLGFLGLLHVLLLEFRQVGIPTQAHVFAVVGIFLETSVVACVSLLLAMTVRSMLIVPMAISFAIIGHSIRVFIDLASKQPGTVVYWISQVTKWVCPHLYQFNFRDAVADGVIVSLESLVQAGLYGSAWLVVLIALAQRMFRERDLV